jgi:hypothetical protein
MKKLRLDVLEVESFATTAADAKVRGTVAGAFATVDRCPVSWGGTCYITCQSCEACETAPELC